MGQQIMWSPIDQMYRGQGSDGTVVTVNEDTMQLAQKRAGRGVYETDWWIETLHRVLEHWGIKTEKWLDPATQVPRLHFSLSAGAAQSDTPEKLEQLESKMKVERLSGPLSTRLLSGKTDEGEQER